MPVIAQWLPATAGAATGLSSVFVIGNSLR